MSKYPLIIEKSTNYALVINESKNLTFDSIRNIDITETIAKSVVDSASLLDVKVIVAATMSGYSARKISNLKPDSLISGLFIL